MRTASTAVLVLALFTSSCASVHPEPTYRTSIGLGKRPSETAQVANGRGLACVAAGEYADAERAFREALQAELACASAHNNLGLALQARGRFYEAGLEFAFAKKLDPRAVEPVINLGRLYEQVGFHKAAIESYERARSIDPKNSEASGRLARSRVRFGESPASAQAFLERLAQYHERNHERSP